MVAALARRLPALTAPGALSAVQRAELAVRFLSDLPRHRAAPEIQQLRPVQRISPDNTCTYLATHDRTQPPADQVVTTERQNILLRQFRARAESKKAQKRSAASSDNEPNAKRHGRDLWTIQPLGD